MFFTSGRLCTAVKPDRVALESELGENTEGDSQ